MISNSKGNIIERVITTILSCQTEEQLDMAFTYSRLAKKYYLNVIGSRAATGQFGLDMVILLYVKLLELQHEKQNSTNH